MNYQPFLIAPFSRQMHHSVSYQITNGMHMYYNRKADVKDISGRRYGRLTVLEKLKKIGRRGAFWLCECDCGVKKEVYGGHLRARTTQSCGCSKESKYYESGLARLYRSYKAKAEKRNIKWDLKLKELEILIKGNCVYCGEIPNQILKQYKSGKIQITYSGIDRVDSEKGYIIENCVSCCKWCNISKSNRKLDDWTNHIIQIAKYRDLK